MARCYIPSATGYKNYGGRGISVCLEWHQYTNFLRDMGERPSENHSLDRICQDGNYEKENCRWATRVIQSTNKRNNRFFSVNGETMCLSHWAKKSGLSESSIKSRLKRGWTISRAVSEPKNQPKKRFAKTITANGETRTVAEWAKIIGIDKRSVRLRIESGWSDIDAVTVPKGAKRLHEEP